jgi:hypothetical protein
MHPRHKKGVALSPAGHLFCYFYENLQIFEQKLSRNFQTENYHLLIYKNASSAFNLINRTTRCYHVIYIFNSALPHTYTQTQQRLYSASHLNILNYTILSTWFVLTWDFIGSVFNWHIKPPRSSSVTALMCKFHVFKSGCDTVTRGLWVITCSCIAWIAFVSAFTHPTYCFVCYTI